jgi:hypothetical protein
MAEIERRIYFYQVVMDDGSEWRRADVLRAIDALQGDDRLMALGNDQWAWPLVDRIPRGREGGRLRFFRDRRSNLPGMATQMQVRALPIPANAGLVEPTHVVLGGDGVIAAEYNHQAPRITSQFARYLQTKLDLELHIEAFVQGSIVEQLERLDYITLFEASLEPTDGLVQMLVDSGPFGDAVERLAHASEGRRVYVRMSSDKENDGFTANAKQFLRKMLPYVESDHGPKVLRVEGLDPVPGDIEVVDLLKQKLVRAEDFEQPDARTKALDTTSAYQHIDRALAEVRQTDLPTAVLIA